MQDRGKMLPVERPLSHWHGHAICKYPSFYGRFRHWLAVYKLSPKLEFISWLVLCYLYYNYIVTLLKKFQKPFLLVYISLIIYNNCHLVIIVPIQVILLSLYSNKDLGIKTCCMQKVSQCMSERVFRNWFFVKICKQVSITPVFAEFLKNKKTHFMK